MIARELLDTATIPGGMYKGSDQDVQTFGVAATFVTSTATSEDAIYQVTKAVFEDLSTCKKLHQAFSTLKKEEMISDGLSIPLHEGAKRYYHEVGLL